MIKIFLELITRNFIALSYLKAENINKKLLNEKIINFKIGKEKQIAELIFKSLVSYHSPWRKITSKYNVIFNSKGVFNDDILNGLSNAPEFSIYQYSRRVNRHIVNSFFPGERLSHFNYLNKDENLKKNFEECENFFFKVIFFLFKKIKIDAWLSGNFGAFDELPITRALKKNNSKFISFHKECMLSKGWWNYFLKAFKTGRTPFEGNKIVVYNQLSKDLIIKSGLCDPDKIDIFGMIRLDSLHHWRKKNANTLLPKKRLGVFFTQPTAQLPSMITDLKIDTYINKSINLRWDKLVKETNKIIYEISLENRDIEIVVKPKLNNENFAKNLYNDFGKIPKNLVVSHNYYNNAEQLIKESDIICAFNSTSVLESIAGGKPVVIPNFAEAKEPIYKNHILDFSDAPLIANKPDELKNIILENLKKPKKIPSCLNKTQIETLNYWTNNPNGELGKKMPILLENLIKD